MKRGKTIPTHQHHSSSSSSHPVHTPSHAPVHAPVHHAPEPHPHRVKHLLYLITFLLILLVLVVFFSFPLSYTPNNNIPSPTASYSLEIPSLSCTWEKDSFTLCATVVWSGADALFAKSYIPGGESLESSPPQTASPFTYCQSIGAEEGYRVVRAMLYSSTGLVRDIGQGVSCTATSPLLPLLPSTTSNTLQTLTIGFRTYARERSSPTGSDIFTKTFSSSVQSCTFVGSWITDNDLYSHNGFCHNAKGTFEGYADAYEQYVVNDPDLFFWADLSQGQLNPFPQRYDGYSMWMELCDDQYYRSNHIPRYGVQGRIEGFGTKTLSFVWNYRDDSNARPAVDFSFDLTCTLSPA